MHQYHITLLRTVVNHGNHFLDVEGVRVDKTLSLTKANGRFKVNLFFCKRM